MNPWPLSWFAPPHSLRPRELLKLPPCSPRPSRSSPVMSGLWCIELHNSQKLINPTIKKKHIFWVYLKMALVFLCILHHLTSTTHSYHLHTPVRSHIDGIWRDLILGWKPVSRHLSPDLAWWNYCNWSRPLWSGLLNKRVHQIDYFFWFEKRYSSKSDSILWLNFMKTT